MINFYHETDFELSNSSNISSWIIDIVQKEEFNHSEISYIFCGDDYLHEINLKYLKHSTLTDIISFDYTLGRVISGDIFISVERVKENAKIFNVSFEDELHRVMAHGVLHFCGYNDKDDKEKAVMRAKEDYYLSLRTF